MLNSRALEGDTVRLESKVAASPPPKLFWKKDKDMLRIDPTRMRWVELQFHHFQDICTAFLEGEILTVEIVISVP